MRLDADLAARLAQVALGHVTREYPNHLAHLLHGSRDACTPRALHPVFYGSLDWHSCVHSYWMLAHLLRLYPHTPPAPAIRALFDEHLVQPNVGVECAYFERPGTGSFERPYGWAWLLQLAAELRHPGCERWSAALAPLEAVMLARFRDFLPRATYPVRAGTHFNTAFALALAADHGGLGPLLHETAGRWYGNDRAIQAWEPGGDDFLSPALIEAECMRRVLPPGQFLPWFDAFLPHLAARLPATLFEPATVSDRSDGKIAHLDGLNLSRAWCLRRLARALPDRDPRRPVMLDAAEAHLAAALPHVAGDYMGEHWLASFAVLALAAQETAQDPDP
ncbi:DUF2891 domain-containing protein [Lichenicoccus sp.]|uniref:DUF2891 domain-containing protein n=1 Tax=Lichenicoccus sp. TaxID=2781899 RepID=UPI003D121AE0